LSHRKNQNQEVVHAQALDLVVDVLTEVVAVVVVVVAHRAAQIVRIVFQGAAIVNQDQPEVSMSKDL
jgi:hypothetical protein